MDLQPRLWLIWRCLPVRRFRPGGCATDLSTPAPTIAITGGKLLTITHGVIENGTIVLSGGKIAAVGAADAVKIPAGAQIVDAKGMTVYPGLIDPRPTSA